MISFNKTLVYASILCLLSISCKAGVFQQITLQGDYLTPNGLHPGIPYTPTPNNWTVWHDIEEVETVDIMGNPIIDRIYKLWLDDGQQIHLLDSTRNPIGPSGPAIPASNPFGQVIIDGEKILWEGTTIGVFRDRLNIYSAGQKTSYDLGFSFFSFSESYQYAFGPNFFAVLTYDESTREFDFDLLSTDTMEWTDEGSQLNSILPQGTRYIWTGLGHKMDVYQNGIDVSYLSYAGTEANGEILWYREHLWMEIPEPMTIGLLGIGAVGLLCRRKLSPVRK